MMPMPVPMPSAPSRRRATARPPLPRAALGALGLMLLAGCSALGGGGKSAKLPVYAQETFGNADTFSRVVEATPPQACEAARRALLSQGYIVSLAQTDRVNAKKNFQPQADSHVEIEFHVVCVEEEAKIPSSVIFVTATQDRYALKKSKDSASVGVSAIGSVSVPWNSSDDSLVKVASETIPAGKFYDGFFQLLERYLPMDIGTP